MLAVGRRRVNKPGVPITVLLGAVKLMMPTIRHPMMMLPIVCTAGVSGFVGGLFNIKGTPDSKGFGLIGLVGPIKSLNLWKWCDQWLIDYRHCVHHCSINFCAIFPLFICKSIKIYNPNIFKYQV